MISSENSLTPLFVGQSVTSTTTYKSKVAKMGKYNGYISLGNVGTAAGVATVQQNNLTEVAYNAACGVTAPATGPSEAQEAANNTGWTTYPMYYPVAGVLTTSGTIALAGGDTFAQGIPKGPIRMRVSWVNASGTSVLDGAINRNEVT